jgi:uncharacterized membrane protein (UPF0127 family)
MNAKRLLLPFLLSALFATGCQEQGCSGPERASVAAPLSQRFEMTLGGRPVLLQVAVTLAEQEKWLMYRNNLGENEGMIFVYKTPQKMRYWMNHVPIPLSIGFFRSDGTLSEVRRMLANDTRTTVSAADDIRFVVEMRDRWYAENGVKPGDELDLAKLAGALRQRGEEPADYGLK